MENRSKHHLSSLQGTLAVSVQHSHCAGDTGQGVSHQAFTCLEQIPRSQQGRCSIRQSIQSHAKAASAVQFQHPSSKGNTQPMGSPSSPESFKQQSRTFDVLISFATETIVGSRQRGAGFQPWWGSMAIPTPGMSSPFHPPQPEALPKHSPARAGHSRAAGVQHCSKGALRPLKQGLLGSSQTPVRGQGCASHTEPAPPHSQKLEQRPQCPQL